MLPFCINFGAEDVDTRKLYHYNMLRNILVLAIAMVAFVPAFSQFKGMGSAHFVPLSGSGVTSIDAVFLFNGIAADSQIEYTGPSSSGCVWAKYDGNFVANTPAVSVEDQTGYVLTVDGNKYYVWVIDYSKYVPVLSGLQVQEGSDKCTNLSINVLKTIPDLRYLDKYQRSHTLSRQFSLVYQDLNYSSSNWVETTRKVTVSTPFSSVQIDAPYKDTEFRFSGDQFATQLGMPLTTVATTYSAIRSECHLTGSIVERDALNEVDKKVSTFEGSGPLNVSLKSNANTPVTQFYEWKIYNEANPSAYIRYNDVDLRYVFNETGNYKVILTTTNVSGTCSYSDSVVVKVSESFIDVPNVFTPNGDGKNDEFRVAYRSIADYKMLVYSSWSGRVYISTNPAEGWNGRIGGRLAPPGAYYYIITATGTDGKKFKLKGNINLLRGKHDK